MDKKKKELKSKIHALFVPEGIDDARRACRIGMFESVKEKHFHTPLFMAVPQTGLRYAMGASVKKERSGEMVIRQMREEDMEQVYSIESSSFSRPWSRDSFLSSLKSPNNLYLVSEEKGTILGYCGVWGIVGEGEITNVAVHRDFRKQGVGEAMLRELLRQAGEKEITAFTLEVRLSNQSAIHLYRKLGFAATAVRKNYYEAPTEDALIMWL